MQISFLDVKTIGNIPELKLLNNYGKVDFYQTTNPEETISRIINSEVVITNKVLLNEAILTHAKKLKLICIAATGTNNVDLEYCRKKGIIVKNAIDYSTKSVAQFTINCLLYFIHKTNYYDQYVKSGSYVQSDIFTHINHDFRELNTMKIGIIGLGAIGREVAKLTMAFGSEVYYYSTSGKNNDPDFVQVNFNQLLQECDVITIHCPLNDKTRNLIGKAELGKMKKNSIIINMGRGGIIDEFALAEALNKNVISGAITDVLTREPINVDNPLLQLKNPEKILITPHIAWASLDARTKLVRIIIGHLKEYSS